MPDLFNQAPLTNPSDLKAIEETLLKYSHWQDRYRHIMLLGKKPAFLA